MRLSGISNNLLHLLLNGSHRYAKLTVRDVQHAVLSLGYSSEDILRRGCPKAPEGNEVDPSVRRMKAVLTHPIGDYAVQPKEVKKHFFCCI